MFMIKIKNAILLIFVFSAINCSSADTEKYIGRWECKRESLDIRLNDKVIIATDEREKSFLGEIDGKGVLVLSGVPTVGQLPLPIDTQTGELICSLCRCNRLKKVGASVENQSDRSWFSRMLSGVVSLWSDVAHTPDVLGEKVFQCLKDDDVACFNKQLPDENDTITTRVRSGQAIVPIKSAEESKEFTQSMGERFKELRDDGRAANITWGEAKLMGVRSKVDTDKKGVEHAVVNVEFAFPGGGHHLMLYSVKAAEGWKLSGIDMGRMRAADPRAATFDVEGLEVKGEQIPRKYCRMCPGKHDPCQGSDAEEWAIGFFINPARATGQEIRLMDRVACAVSLESCERGAINACVDEREKNATARLVSSVASEDLSAFDALTPAAIQEKMNGLSETTDSKNISGKDLQKGTTLVYMTNEKRFGKLLVLHQGYDLHLKWTTYDAEGNLFSQSDGSIVRGTWSFDLDYGDRDRSKNDFFWEQIDDTNRQLTFRKGAIFAIN